MFMRDFLVYSVDAFLANKIKKPLIQDVIIINIYALIQIQKHDKTSYIIDEK